MIPYRPIKEYNFGNISFVSEELAMYTAIFVFIVWVFVALRKDKKKIKDIAILFLLLITSGAFFSRLWYFLSNWEGAISLIKIFMANEPGQVSLGWIFGGAIGLLIYIMIFNREEKTIAFAKLADIVAIPAALSFFIYRLFGCTIYGDIKGTPSNLPWCFMWPDGICRHPVSVYMALASLLIFIVLIVFFGKEKK